MKKQYSIMIVAIGVLLALLLSPSVGRANYVDSLTDVTMHWDTFGYTLGSGITGITWSNQQSSISAGLNGSVQTDSVNDWTSPIGASLPLGVFGMSAANDQQLRARSGAQMGTIVNEWGYQFGDFLANRSGDFTVSGSGDITFFVDADIIVSIASALGSGDWFYTLGSAMLTVDGSSVELSHELYNYYGGGWTENISGQSPLSITMSFIDGQVGHLGADVYSATRASVPEPSTMLLLGFGLAGIFGLGKRKSSAA